MKRLFLLILIGLTCRTLGQTVPLYENRGVVDQPLNIDATSFLNGGVFNVAETYTANDVYFYFGGYGMLQLFDTQNTLYYTNLANASMISDGGFNFYFQTNSFQKPAAVIENYGTVDGQIITLKATNILSTGIIRASGGGLVKIDGKNVDLSRGGVAATGSGNIIGIPGISYSDETPIYYGVGDGDVLQGAPMSMDPSTFALPKPSSPIHDVYESYTFGGLLGRYYFTQSTIVPTYYSVTNTNSFSAFANTNSLSPTSEVVQVIFVNTNSSDTNIIIKAGFASVGRPQVQGNLAAIVEWSLPGYDPVAAVPATNYLTFIDTFGTMTNALFRTNWASGNIAGEISGVNAYNVYLGTAPYYYRFTNNAVFDTNMLVNPAYTNKNVTNSYVGYGLSIGQTETSTAVSEMQALLDITNRPARVEINADNLDLSYSRIKTDNMMMINATNLISLEGMVLDSPVVKYNVGTTNNTLVISNFVVKSISRLIGDVYAYSAVFTNGYTKVNNGTTNDVEVRMHVLIIDHYMQGSRPVDVYAMTANATNIVVQDDLVISHQFKMNSEGVDIRGELAGSALDSSTDQLFPRLKYLTNSGIYSTVNGAFLGERITNMQEVVNHGLFSAQGLSFKANSLLNDGTLSAGAGAMVLQSKLQKLDQGKLTASGAITIIGDEVKVRSTAITAGSIDLTVTNLLSDAGYVNSGIWSVSNGFNLNIKPASGDLLGTTISATAGQFKQSFQKWAGEDRGRSPAGFNNNAAIGKLILTGDKFSRFNFSGAGKTNALYVDYLQLNGYSTNLGDGLVISSNMTIYFAAANVPVEQLDGKVNGRLKWISNYAGANSSTNITLSNGQTLKVNLSLLTSMSFDSDADGIVNGRDTTPFGGVKLASITVTNTPAMRAVITWNGAGQTAYNVEYATNIFSPAWQLMTNVVNDAVTNKVLSVTDVPAVPGTQRYYRVSYTP